MYQVKQTTYEDRGAMANRSPKRKFIEQNDGGIKSKQSNKTISDAPLTRLHTQAILNCLYNFNPILSNLLYMQSLTGLRFSDCRELILSDFKTSNGEFRKSFIVYQIKLYNSAMTRIENHPDKSAWSEDKKVEAAKRASKHTVLITEKAKEVVEDCVRLNPNISQGGYLFENRHHFSNGNPISNEYANRILKGRKLKEALKTELLGQEYRFAGIESIDTTRLGTHSFRKDGSQRLIENNANPVEVQKFLGQRTLDSTSHYVVAREQIMRDLVEKL